MKIECKRLSISDDEFGLEITFYEKEKGEDPESLDYDNISEVINSIGPYFLLQRSYPEDEFERDYYYIELSDFDGSGELKEFTITLIRKKLIIEWGRKLAEIELKINDIEIDKLLKALQIFTAIDGNFIIKE